MKNLSEVSKSSLASSLQSARRSLSRYREQSQQAVKQATSGAVSIGTGYGIGYLYAHHPELTKIADTDVDTAVAVGALGVLGGMAGIAGDQSDHLLSAGVGALTAYAALRGAGVAGGTAA